jgi:polar amino acid transport system substrate-binding protein
MNARLTNATNLLLICLLTFVSVIAGADTLERVRNSHSVVLGDVPDFAPFSTHSKTRPAVMQSICAWTSSIK